MTIAIADWNTVSKLLPPNCEETTVSARIKDALIATVFYGAASYQKRSGFI